MKIAIENYKQLQGTKILQIKWKRNKAKHVMNRDHSKR